MLAAILLTEAAAAAVSPHGWVLFGRPAPGQPLYALHGAASKAAHYYDASWRVRLFDASNKDITDEVQRGRAAADEGVPWFVGCCGAEPFTEFDLTTLAAGGEVSNLPLYKGYNPPNADAVGAFKAAGLPVQLRADGVEVPAVTGEVIYATVTARFDAPLTFRRFSQIEPRPFGMAYHLVGTNTQPYAQHRIGGSRSSWSQVLPVSLGARLLADSAGQPQPPTTQLGGDGSVEDTSAMRTLDVEHGNCWMHIPDHADDIEQRLQPDQSIAVHIYCEYYCATQLGAPALCRNRLSELGARADNALILPTVRFETTITTGVTQGLLASNVLMEPGAATLLSEAGALRPVKPKDDERSEEWQPNALPRPLSFVQSLAISCALLLLGGLSAALLLKARQQAGGGMPARAIFKNSRADLQEEVSIKTPPTPARRSIPSRSNSHHDQLSLALNISTTPATSDMVSLVHGPPSDAPAAYSDNLWEAQAKAQAAAAAEWPAAMFVRGYVITPIQSAIRAATSRLATVTAAPGVRLALAAAALILATALLSAVGLSSGDSPYLVGTVLAPLKPNSHIFTHGFRSSATHEYAVTLLALPVGEAEQTHEIYFDEGSRTAFSTMVGSSRLIQVPFDRFGRMADHVQEWTVGHPAHNPHPEEAGLHNVAGSDRFPGCIWIATETDDRVYLVDPSDGFRVLYEMHTPTTLVTGSGVIHHVGGPHSVREGHSGEIWVALKGSNYDGPGYDDPKQAAYYKAMMDKHFMDENEPVPDGWAVWRVHPDAYNASAAPAKGGIMWEAYESPTMTAIDGVGNAWTTQDRTDYILHVDTAGVATQVKLPEMVMDDGEVWSFKNGNGPGIATDPQGAVWLTNLGQARPWLVKFHAGSTDPMIFKDLERLGGPADAGLHTIHVAFSATGGPHRDTNVMYVLTSALLTPGSVEAVIVQEMDEDWVLPVDGAVGHQKIVLTSVNSAAHRIAIAESTEPRSILVSGLLSNTLYQISGRSI